jgi:hypothetical protein
MKIIVFIRSHNDFDHVLPILDYFIREKFQEVEIYGIGNHYKKCSKHIHYLENVLLKKIIPFSEKKISKIDNKILDINEKLTNILCKNSNIFSEIIKFNLTLLLHFLASFSVKRFVKGLSVNSIILMDTGTESRYPYKHIIRSARLSGIQTIGYNHGYDIFTVDPIKDTKVRSKFITKIISKYLVRNKQSDYCDRYIIGPKQIIAYTNNSLHAGCFNYSKMYEIGLPRFSKEWVKRFFKLNYKTIRRNEKLNVILFLSNVKFNVDTLELDKTITALSSSVNINFKIVPHTRSGMSGAKHVKSNITNFSSVEAIKWADVGIVYGSSIGLHMLVEGVTLIYPQFIDNNTNIYSDNNVAVVVDSLNDMLDFFESYTFEASKHNIDSIDQFINTYIYGGYKSYNSMMERYYFYIVQYNETL